MKIKVEVRVHNNDKMNDLEEKESETETGKEKRQEDMKIIALSGYSNKQHIRNIVDRRNGTLTPAERVASGGRIKKPHAQRPSSGRNHCHFCRISRLTGSGPINKRRDRSPITHATPSKRRAVGAPAGVWHIEIFSRGPIAGNQRLTIREPGVITDVVALAWVAAVHKPGWSGENAV